MSREVSAAEQVLKAVLNTALGVGLGVATTTLALLLAEHMKRKADKGLLHWPFMPERQIWLGGMPEWAMPMPIARPQPAPYQPAPGTRVNLSGMVELAGGLQ